MSRAKLITSYILTFIASILMLALSVSFILKTTVYNENKVLAKFDNSDYYASVTEDIRKSMKNSILSSGLTDEILEDLYTADDVKTDVTNTVKAFYKGEKYEVPVAKLTEKLNANIDAFLVKNNYQVSEKESVNSYIKEIIDTYKNKVGVYGYLNKASDKFVKSGKLLNTVMAVSAVSLLICLAAVRFMLRAKQIGTVFLTCGLMLYYLRYFIYRKIDYSNILIIHKKFSEIIRDVFGDIDKSLMIYGTVLAVLGLAINVFVAFGKRSETVQTADNAKTADAAKTAPAAEQTPARQTGGQSLSEQSLSEQPSFGQSSVQSLSAPAAAQPAAQPVAQSAANAVSQPAAGQNYGQQNYGEPISEQFDFGGVNSQPVRPSAAQSSSAQPAATQQFPSQNGTEQP